MCGFIHRVRILCNFFSNGCRFLVNVTGNTHKGFSINRVSSDCIDTFVLTVHSFCYILITCNTTIVYAMYIIIFIMSTRLYIYIYIYMCVCVCVLLDIVPRGYIFRRVCGKRSLG